jgi:hypothetical protein
MTSGKRCIPQWLVDFIPYFLSGRTTSLCSLGYSSSPFLSQQGVQHGSPLFPILFLFYRADLIDVCNFPDLTASGIGFINDANVLALVKNTAETCSLLKEIHSCCLT